MVKSVVCFLFCLVFVLSVHGEIHEIITIGAVEDAFICSSDWATVNFGWMEKSQRAVGQQNDFTGNQIGRMLYKFQLPDNIISLNSAVLKLGVWDNFAGYPTDTGVYGAEDNWQEYMVTWNNQPSHYGAVLDYVTASCCGTTYDFNVTDYVDLSYFHQDNTISFMLKSVDESTVGGLRWFARESDGRYYGGSSNIPGFLPRLVLDAYVIPEPASIFLLGLGGFAVLRKRF